MTFTRITAIAFAAVLVLLPLNGCGGGSGGGGGTSAPPTGTQTVTITPDKATVNASSPGVLLTAAPAGGSSGQFVYKFSVSGAAGGSLENSTGTSSKSSTLTTTDDQAQYLVNINAQNAQTDTVTVTVFKNTGTVSSPVAGAEVGTASSVVTVQLQEVGACGVLPSPFATGTLKPTISVSPSVISPGDTITVTMTTPANTTGTLNVGGNGNLLVHSVSSSANIAGINHTYPDDDPRAGGFSVGFAAAQGDTITVKIVVDKATPDQCPTKGSGDTVASLGGVWVEGFSEGVGGTGGVVAVPLEISGAGHGD